MSTVIRLVGVVVCACVLARCAGPSSSIVSPLAPSGGNAVVAAVDVTAPRLVQPDAVLVDQFSGQLDRAIRKAFRVFGSALLGRTVGGDLVVVPIGTRPAATYTFPDPGGAQVPVPNDVTVATFVVNISLADKLAVGKTFAWEFWFSADNGATWVFHNGGGFTSFGPGGFTDHLGNVNPDPVLNISVGDKRGQLIRGIIRLPQPIDLGVTISTLASHT